MEPSQASDILAVVRDRDISEVRHFTTSRGLLGVLRTQKLLSRKHLSEEDEVRLIAINNCYRRWDNAWFGHVNLSIERINGYLYGISSGRWHAGEDLWWAVLGLDPAILAHDGVVFTTTNNGYSVVQRARGAAGLEALFAESVVTWRGDRAASVTRAGQATNIPTCAQAEALYPDFVDTRWLRKIYVPQAELADSVYGWLEVTNHPPVEVVHDASAFE